MGRSSRPICDRGPAIRFILVLLSRQVYHSDAVKMKRFAIAAGRRSGDNGVVEERRPGPVLANTGDCSQFMPGQVLAYRKIIMNAVVLDANLAQRLIAERCRNGVDRYDEVWEGVYMMAPAPSDEHQDIVTELIYMLRDVLGGGNVTRIRPGVNLSGSEESWERDFRIPDVAVLIDKNDIRCRGSFWLGADFIVEIASPGEEPREKLPFYSRLDVGENLIVDRDPWVIELFWRDGEELRSVGRSTLDQADTLASRVLPFTFQLIQGESRPQIQVRHNTDDRVWLV